MTPQHGLIPDHPLSRAKRVGETGGDKAAITYPLIAPREFSHSVWVVGPGRSSDSVPLPRFLEGV